MRSVFFLLFMAIQFPAFTQVGIGTSDPHPDVLLDINGGLRVRDYSEGSATAAKDSIAVFDGRGVVQSIPSRALLANMDKSLVKAKLTSNYAVGVLTTVPLAFDTEDFDIKNEFDTSTGYFVAENDGIYRVTGQIKTASLSAGTLAIRAYKTNLSNVQTLIAEENFVNVSITLVGTGINVSPPTRSVSTLVQLEAGEKISFSVYTAVSLNVLGSAGGYDSFCTIEQVR